MHRYARNLTKHLCTNKSLPKLSSKFSIINEFCESKIEMYENAVNERETVQHFDGF